MSKKNRGLGRGLSALLENAETDITSTSLGKEHQVVGAVSDIPIAFIEANPFNPRTHFEQEALEELASSIKEHGIIQPLTVRKMGNDKYQLISGERRFRASQLASLTEVPVYIRIANDQTMLEMALVENIQREDLDAMEVALSYQRLIEECSLTQEGLSERVGKKRATIANYMRLLKLPAQVQAGIRAKQISMGHARALVSAGDTDKQLALFQLILDEGLSVRQAEALARENNLKSSSKSPSKTAAGKKALNYSAKKFQTDLADRLAAKVQLQQATNGKGKIVINFKSEDDLERLMTILDF